MSAPLPRPVCSVWNRRLNTLSGAVSRTVRDLGREMGLGGGTSPAPTRRGGLESGGVQELEPRRLFTTLVGGDTFEFTQPDPNNGTTTITTRVVLTGNVVAELVGGFIDPNSPAGNPQVVISDVPGVFQSSAIGRNTANNGEVLGGLGGGRGIRELVEGDGGLSIVSPLNRQRDVPHQVGGSANFNFKALAVDSTGVRYGINVFRPPTTVGGTPPPLGTTGEISIIQLLRLSDDGLTGTVVAELQSRVNGATPNSEFLNPNGVGEVTSAAFNPLDGFIYFTLRGNDRGGGSTAGAQQAQQMYRVDPNATNVLASMSAVRGTFFRGLTQDQDAAVTAIAFDQQGASTGAASVTLTAFVVDSPNGVARGRLVRYTNFTAAGTDTSTPTSQVNVRVGTAAVTAVTGLAFVNDDPNAAESTVFAVESTLGGGAVQGVTAAVANAAVGAQALQISTSTGLVTELGRLAVPGANNAAGGGAGANLQDLTYLPNVRNPITGQRGVLLAVDDSTDELVFVDSRNRFPRAQAFSLFISQSDSTSSIVMGQVANFDPANPTLARPMQPFAGSAGTLRVTGANGQGTINITGPTGVGGVFLGLKTNVNGNADLSNIPQIAGQLGTSLGVRGAGAVTSGVVSSSSLLRALTNQTTLSQRLIDQNVGDVSGMVVAARGPGGTFQIYAIDSDGVDSGGQPIANDQIVTIDRTTGKAVEGSSRSITNVLTGAISQNNRGLAVDDNERILAVFLQQFATGGTGGTGGESTGTIVGDYPDFTAAGQSVISLSIFNSGPTGFILAESTAGTTTRKFLYSFSNVSGRLAFTSLGQIVDADGNTVAAARALGHNGSRLFTVGFPRGNPLPTQNTGGTTVDLSGIDTRGLTYAADGNVYVLSSGGQGFQIRILNRDAGTGAVTSLGAPVTILSGGAPVQAINDLTADPGNLGNNLLGIGSSSASLLPSRAAGDLTQSNGQSDFIYRGLTRLTRDTVFAVTFNGSTLNLRRASLVGTPLQTSPNSFNVIPGSPRTTPDNIPGTDVRFDANPASARGATTAILGVTATTRRPGDTTGIYGVGYSADSLLPTSPVLGDLGDANVLQLSMSGFSPSYSFPDASYVIPTLGGNNYSFTRYLTAVRDTATSGLLTSLNSSLTIQVVGQGWTGPSPFPVPSVQGGTPEMENGPFDNLGTVANGIVDTRAFATDRRALGNAGVYLTTGWNYDAPVPGAPVPGNFGTLFGVDPTTGESNIRGFAFNDAVAPGQLQDGYSIVFNGTSFDAYRLTRSTTTGGITGFSKVSTGSGLLDPTANERGEIDQPIFFIYTLFKDTQTANRFFFIGSSAPTAGNPTNPGGSPMRLYALDIVTGTGGTLTAVVNNTDQPPRALTGAAPGATDGFVFKAGAVDAAGNMWLVQHTNSFGDPPNTIEIGRPSSALFQADRTSGNLTSWGFIGTKGFGSGVPSAGSGWSVDNSNVRAMQFRVDTDGNEKLIILDDAFSGGPRIAELDFNNIKTRAQAQVGGIPSSFSGVPNSNNPYPAAVALQSSLPGMVDGTFSTFAIDQYGRGYSISPGTSTANPERLFVSPNELFQQEIFDEDGDNYAGENVRMGWLVNPDGTAFFDSFTTMTGDLTGQRIIGVVRNELTSSLRSTDPLFGRERLVSLTVPGSTSNPTVNGNTAGNQTRIVVSPVVRANTPTDTGEITVNGAPGTPGVASNIVGLGFDVEGALIGLDRTTTGGGRLVGFTITPPDTTTSVLFGDPTFNTLTLTDQASTPITTDPRGFSTDIFGRFYTVDGTTVGTAGFTRLLVSPNTVSLFRIDTTTGVAAKIADLADNSQLQQQPVLSRFGGVAFQNADTLFLVQKDLRSGGIFLNQNGTPLGVDRLVSLTFPSTTGGTVSFARFNDAVTAGALQVGNSVASPGTSNGTPTGLSAIDFTSTGQLIGLSNRFGRDGANFFAPLNALVRIEIDPTNSLAPTNSTLVSVAGAAAGLEGLTAFGTQLASVAVNTSPDRLVFSNNDLSIFSVNAGTGVGTQLSNVTTTVNGQNVTLTDDQPVTVLATQPATNGGVTGLVYAIFRGTEVGTGTPADFLYSVNASTGVATLVGQVRLTRDAAGNPVTGAAQFTNLSALEFSGEIDAAGNFVLLGVNDPAGANNRQVVRISITTTAEGTTSFADAEAVRGSDPGEFLDAYLGFASDLLDSNTTRLPTADRGRFFTLDTSFANAVRLNITPTQLYAFNDATPAPFGPNSASFQTVGNLFDTPTTNTPSGGALLSTLTSLDFNPVDQRLFGIRPSNAGSTLLQFPASLPAPLASTASPQSVPALNLAFGGPVRVTAAATSGLGNQPVPTLTGTNIPAFVSSIFFLPGGTLRAVARLENEGTNRIIDIPVATPTQSIARTNAGVPDALFANFQEADGLVYALDFTVPTDPRITIPNTTGVFIPVTGGGGNTGGGNVLGSPTLGFVDPAAGTFTPVDTGSLLTPGRLPTSITDVKALAFDRANGLGGGKGLYLVDQANTLIKVNLTVVAGVTTFAGLQTIGIIRDAGSGRTINVGSMTFDNTGRLLVQDADNARLVDVSTVTAVAGNEAATASGSLPPTVGAITYDPVGQRLLVADNSTGVNTVAVGSGASSQIFQVPLTLTASAQDIGSVFIGGTVLGDVEFAGSVGTFYAGWLATGTATGLGLRAPNPNPGNFSVGGDLRELVTVGPIGTAGVGADFRTATYFTGTDIRVGGRIGTVRTAADSAALFRAFGSAPASPATGVYTENELKTPVRGLGTGETIDGINFAAARLSDGRLFNDTFATAQRLAANSSGTAVVNGSLENGNRNGVDASDPLDFYSIPLFAGQTVDLSLNAPTGAGLLSGLYFGIFDPSGRLVFSNHSSRADAGGLYRFRAQVPGEYRVVVATPGDTNFNGAIDAPYERGFGLGAVVDYTLTLSGLGDTGIGAVTVGGTLLDVAPDTSNTPVLDFSGVFAAQGDIGGISAGAYFSLGSALANSVRSVAGGIRSIDAGQIGELRNGAYVAGISLSSAADVGLIRSTGGVLVLNRVLNTASTTTTPTTTIPGIPPIASTAVGTSANYNPEFTRVRGNIQVISSAGTFLGNVLTDKGLGSLLAGNMAPVNAETSFINVNADQAGNDGTIDLIDVAGDLGTLAGGGPVIYTNAGGNVRYIRAGGTIFRDRAFGGGTNNVITLNAGQNLTFIDDSGSSLFVEFDTRSLTLNPGFDPNNPDSPRFLNAPQITYRPYGIRSGGAVLMNLQITGLGSSNVLPGTDPQLRLRSGGTFEISSLVLGGSDDAVTLTTNATTGSVPVFSQAGTSSASPSYRVVLSGSRIDVASTSITDSAITAVGNITEFRNDTSGEILSFSADSIGTLSVRGDLGLPRATATGVSPQFRYNGAAIGNLYPFVAQENIVQLGNVINVRAGGSIANLVVNNASEVTANDDGDNPGAFEGIAGPVISFGVLNTVNAGEGILPSGLGNVGGGMVIAVGRLDQIFVRGDVRGLIASTTSIGTVSVSGAVINTLIAVYTPQVGANPFFDIAPINNDVAVNIVLSDTGSPLNPGASNPAYELGSFRAGSGVIGTDVYVADIRSISVGGFGVINSLFQSAGGGRYDFISVAGYGIRGTSIDAGSFVSSINATGNGSNLSTSSVTASVRRSEFESIDAFFGIPVGPGTDIHAYLSTSAATPVINGVTDTGVIEDAIITGNGTAGSISAYQIRGSVPGTTNSVISFSGSIGTITTRSLIDGLTVRAGKLNAFRPASDVLSLDMTVAGPLGNLNIRGDLAGNSRIASTGPNASLRTLTVRGNFDGALDVSGTVGTINVGGNLTNGTININPAVSRRTALTTLNVGGDFRGASLTANGNVGTISVAGSMGTTGDTLNVTGNLANLRVGTGRNAPSGKALALTVNVGGNIGTINVRGRITGAITAAGSISSIIVASDGAADRTLIAAPVASTSGSINGLTLTNGDIGANVSAFNNLRTLKITGGSILPSSTVSTARGTVNSVDIRNGNLLGTLRSGDTATGLKAINSLTVSGQVGDGTNPARVLASSIRTAKTGTVFSNSTIETTGNINSLTINGDLQANATVKAESISRLRITGARDGNVIVG